MDELVTVPDVEIVSTGTYDLGTGKTTFTQEDLADAVLAASDPTVKAPRIKLGHKDKRFEADLDAEPAFGVVANQRLVNNGQTIKADLQGVPKWLADAMPTAFPARSIEGGFDFKAASGRDYKLVISNLALLGTTWPGVTSLDDLKACLSANGPVLSPVQASDGGYTLAGKDGEGHAARLVMAKIADRQPVEAKVDLGAINRRFAADLAAGKITPPAGVHGLGEVAKWWARSVQAGDDGSLSVVVDDETGHLLEVPFSVEGEAVTWSAPTVLSQDFSSVSASGGRQGPRILASWPASPGREAPKEVKTMDVDQSALAKRLGLAEDADEAAIAEALKAEPTKADPVAASGTLPEGVVAIDATKLAELQSGAKAGVEVQASLAKAERDGAITKAIEGGRIAASGRETWEKRWDTSPDESRTLLTASVDEGGLAEVIPVKARELGRSGDGEGDPSADAALEAAIDARFFPELATSGGAS